MRLRKKLRKKKLDFDKIIPDNDDTEGWLGEELVKEGNDLLNNCPPKEELIVRSLIATKNWYLAMEEIGKLEKEIKKLEAQIQILRRD